MTKITAAIFDYGNVLSLTPAPPDYRELRRLADLEEEEFILLYWKYREEYDRNVFDGTSYWQQIAAEAARAFSAAQISDLNRQDIALWTRTDASMLAWVELLKASGVKTALLSNMPVTISAYLRRSAAWLRHFDHLAFSGELGLVKPDPAIYYACLEGLGARPAETLFIDDRQVNIEAARAIGMPSLLFESAGQLARAVEPFGLPAAFAPSGASTDGGGSHG